MDYDFKSNNKVEVAYDANLCAAQDICLILQPIKSIEKLNFVANPKTIVVDFWRILPKEISKNIKNYMAYGVNSDQQDGYVNKANLLKLTK